MVADVQRILKMFDTRICHLLLMSWYNFGIYVSLKRGDCFVLLPKMVEFSNVKIKIHTLLLLELFDIHNVHLYLRLLHPLL